MLTTLVWLIKHLGCYTWSFRPDFFGVLYLFIPWTYKPDNDHLNTYISPSVVCVSSIAKTLYWNMEWEAIFATISPFLVIDDNTTKASKMNCKNKKLVPNWKVRNYLACSDDISMLILKATGIWLVHRTKCFRLDSNCETMACGQCKTIVWFEPYEQWKFLYLSLWDHQIALLPHID